MAEAKSLEQELKDSFTSTGGGDERQPAGTTTEPATTQPADTGGTPDPTPQGEPGADRARDEHGRFVKQDKEAGDTAGGETSPKPGAEGAGEAKPAAGEVAPAAAETAKPAETLTDPAQQADSPPSSWRPAAKAEYARLPEPVREEIKKRETDFQRGIEQYKSAANVGRSFYEILKPFEAHLAAEGATPQQAVKSILEITQRLRTGAPQDKVGTLLWLGQQYGVDLSTAIGATPEQTDDMNGAVQRAMAPFMQQFETFRQSQEQAKQQQQEQRQQQVQQAIHAFRTATDEKGKPKHIYFDNVWEQYMRPYLQSGTAKSLDQAYELACRAHPEVSAALSAEQQKSAEAQRLEDQRKKAEDAKRSAAANVQSQGGVGMADTRKLSVEEELRAHMKGQRI